MSLDGSNNHGIITWFCYSTWHPNYTYLNEYRDLYEKDYKYKLDVSSYSDHQICYIYRQLNLYIDFRITKIKYSNIWVDII